MNNGARTFITLPAVVMNHVTLSIFMMPWMDQVFESLSCSHMTPRRMDVVSIISLHWFDVMMVILFTRLCVTVDPGHPLMTSVDRSVHMTRFASTMIGIFQYHIHVCDLYFTWLTVYILECEMTWFYNIHALFGRDCSRVSVILMVLNHNSLWELNLVIYFV